MLKRVMDKKHNDEGFTLIELLIVVVILGILASVVVFAVSGIANRGATAACKSDLKAVQTAVEAYYAKTKAYPTSAAPTAATANAERMAAITTDPNKFLREDPSGDSWDVEITGNTGTVASTVDCATL